MAAVKLGEFTCPSSTNKLKLDLDDKALIKALAAFDKTDEPKHEPRLGQGGGRQRLVAGLRSAAPR